MSIIVCMHCDEFLENLIMPSEVHDRCCRLEIVALNVEMLLLTLTL